MQESNEKNKKTHTDELSTPYILSNLGLKAGVISFSVSAATQPFQALLTRMQMSGSLLSSPVSQGLFRSVYRGFFPFALAGQKRGAVALTAKQSNREAVGEEGLELEAGAMRQTMNQPYLGTFYFSQGDIIISNGLSNKAKLDSAGITTKANFNWSTSNYARLTTVNWGSRSISGFVNFSAIGFAGDYISSFYKFENELYNKILGGATAGVFATFATTLPNSYGDRKLLASKMEHGRLLTTTPFTMFKAMSTHVKDVGMKEALFAVVKMNLLRESLVRSPQAALTFSIIFGLDHLMGPEPLKKLWPNRLKNDEIHSPRPPANGL